MVIIQSRRGAYSAGFLSQVNDSGTVENNTSLETTDKTNIVTYGENAVGVLACSSLESLEHVSML